jgi:mannose-6-phosphate isomerase
MGMVSTWPDDGALDKRGMNCSFPHQITPRFPLVRQERGAGVIFHHRETESGFPANHDYGIKSPPDGVLDKRWTMCYVTPFRNYHTAAERMPMNRPDTADNHRPWGYFIVLADKPDHKVKRIVVHPGKRLSLQSHNHRSEHWHVISGTAVATVDDHRISLTAGESADIPCGAKHRVENPGKNDDLVFIEVQRGDYFGEDDIVRFEDDFGRT